MLSAGCPPVPAGRSGSGCMMIFVSSDTKGKWSGWEGPSSRSLKRSIKCQMSCFTQRTDGQWALMNAKK